MTRTELNAARTADYEAELAQTTNSFDAYWAGSAIHSLARDYKAGRVVTIRPRRRKAIKLIPVGR